MSSRPCVARSVRPLYAIVPLALLSLGACFNPSDDPPPSSVEEPGNTTTGEAAASTGAALTGSEEETSGSAEASTGASTSGEDPAERACSDYCSLITDHCQDGDAQYSGQSLCEASCASMPLGTVGDELGNSVFCRTFHAVLAAEDPAGHCLHAGPAGDGTCGSNCESFCVLAANTCAGDLAPYPDAESCIEACEGYEPDPPYSADVPDGDTFACRLRHLTLASLQPEIHCSHLAAESPVCFD